MKPIDNRGWRKARWAVLDIETTGLRPERDRVLEVAVLIHEDGRQETAWHVALDPGVLISANLRNTVGEVAEDTAGRPTFEEVADDLVGLLDGAVVISCGVESFDWPFLAAELERVGTTVPSPPLLDPRHWFHELTGETTSTLAKTCRAAGVPEPRSSSPQDAILATLALAQKLAPKLPDSLDDLLRVQERARAAREAESERRRQRRRAEARQEARQTKVLGGETAEAATGETTS